MMSGDAAYRVLLRALPADLRRDFGDDMVQLFRDQRLAMRGRRLCTMRLWLAAIVDVLREALTARAQARRPDARSWRQIMRASALDIRHGLRLLRRHPASSALAIATLALGIGANTAIFSVVDTVLIRELPYQDPDRLVMLWEKRPAEGVMTNVVSPADYLDWRRMQTSFEHVAAIGGASASLTNDGEPVELPAAVIGWSFFDLLGVRMQHGRSFQAAHETPGNHRVLIISHGLWQRRYGGEPGIIGRRVTVNGNPGWEVIGVLPREFRFIDEYDLWAPMVIDASTALPSRVSHQLDVYARLKPHVTFAQALDEMDRIGRQLEALYPDQSRGHGAHVQPMREKYVSAVRERLVILLSAVGFVLLIACVNTASLLLARAAARRREMAVRAALGASRGRLIVQTLSESVTLAVTGGLAGLAVAMVLLAALPLIMPERLSVVGVDDIGLDGRVLMFALAVSIATGIVFGLLPALSASRPNVVETLNTGGRGAAGVRKAARRTLVITEVALASLTLVGAGLAIRSFYTILAQPLGFEAANRLTMSISLPSARYRSPEDRMRALAEIETRLGAVPGVRTVGGITLLPLSGNDGRSGVEIEGRDVQEGDPPTRMHPRIVTRGYFTAMAIAVVRGRAFTPADATGGDPVVIVSETSASRYWPGQNPIGRRMRFVGDEAWRTIVGVAADVRHWGLTRSVNPMVYRPLAQAANPSFLTFVVAAETDAASLAPSLRQAVAGFDRHLPLASVQTMEQLVQRSVRSERAQMLLMGTFGMLALVLAVIGIYGVTSQLVVTRRHEIGVRMTLGARPIDILRHLLGEGLSQAATGLVLGLVAGVWLMQLASALLFDVRPWDPITLASVSALLLGATTAAVLIPARRAMAVDPASTLRAT